MDNRVEKVAAITREMIEAGKVAFGDTELVGDDYMARALTNAYAAMSALTTKSEVGPIDDERLSAVRLLDAIARQIAMRGGHNNDVATLHKAAAILESRASLNTQEKAE